MIYEAGFFWRAGLTKWWGLSGAEWLHTSANVQVAIYFTSWPLCYICLCRREHHQKLKEIKKGGEISKSWSFILKVRANSQTPLQPLYVQYVSEEATYVQPTNHAGSYRSWE